MNNERLYKRCLGGVKVSRGVRFALFGGFAALFLAFSVGAKASSNDQKLGSNMRMLAEIMRTLDVNYVDTVDTDEMLTTAAAAMTRKLDPYTEYIPESAMSDFEFMTTGKYGGIGALIRTKGEYTAISEPYKDTPADKAGLKAGDMILAVDGVDIKNFDSSKVSDMMKGTPGTKVVLTIRQLTSDQVVEVPIIRDRIVVSGVSYYGMVADSVGIIVHNQFTEDCSNDIRKAFDELRAQGATSLILDLRGNGGGILQEAVKIVSMFVDKGTEVVRMMGRSQASQEIFTTELEPVDTQIPLVVLVDNSSASASEIVAGSLQDLDRAVLVGARTFGKGLVQSTAPIGGNSYLKLTTAKYYTPSGRCIQAIDYAHRDENGAVSHVPDSLVSEFTTAGGRKVYDGGGVMPDIKVEVDDISEFTGNLYVLGYIEDFANDYYRRHADRVLESDFELGESEYELFKRSLDDKDIKFRSRASYIVDQLRSAVEDNAHADEIEQQLGAIEATLSPDKAAGLERYKQELIDILEREIVRRFNYAWGATEYSLAEDVQLDAALEVLGDRAEYRRLLEEADLSAK